jgi:prepilin-type N-terminal cleavage/methylation domain-containing protein
MCATDARTPRNWHGFTLVEMMVVMVIIVILSTFLLPVVFRSRDRALDRQAQAEARSIVLAAKSYRAVFGKWPAQVDISNRYYFTNNHLVITQLMGFNPRNRSFISIASNQLDSKSNFLDPRGIPYLITIIQSGTEKNEISFTNYYTCEKEGSPKYNQIQTYAPNFTNRVAVGAGAFMNKTNELTVNSWSEF